MIWIIIVILTLCILAYVSAVAWFTRNYKDPLIEPEEFCFDDLDKENKLREYSCHLVTTEDKQNDKDQDQTSSTN